jgi:hypothetical protein
MKCLEGLFHYLTKLKLDSMTPPKGYYRQLLNEFPDVRIAFTHTPIYGCRTINAEPFIKVLDASNDVFAKFYADGLRNGSLVTIVENNVEKVYANNGELYFTT